MRGSGLILAFLMAWASGLAQTPALDSLPNCTPVPGYRHRPTEDYYARAYDTIQAMVDGQKPLDFQKAVFLTEWAYLDGRMNPALFSAAIDRAAHFCQLLARQHGADTAKNPQLYYNWAAYNWVSDTVRVVVAGDTVERMPYRYDFDDYEGRAEWANTFVSKLLATGSGTCRSMPYLYKMLCDKLGAKSWLALAPQHVYVKHTNGDPNYPVLYNVETTSGSFPTDGWIMASSYVTLEGILSSMYMDSLTQREAVALTLVDLAKGWQRRFGDRGPVDEDHFALKCAEACLAAHPENPNARLLRAELLRRRWARTGLERDSVAMAAAHVALAADGYREMPAEMYRDWVEGVRTNGGELLRRDVSRPFDPQKEFGNSGGTPVVTLSDGRFREFYESDTVIRVGRVLIDLRSGLVVGFVDRDTLTSEATLEPEITSRWLSVDPLAGKFPYMSPYAAFANNPVLFVDPDGKAPIIAQLLIQGSVSAVADFGLQVIANYLLNGFDVPKAFDDVDWGQVGLSAFEGMLPWKGVAGKLATPAIVAAADVTLKFAQGGYDKLEGDALTHQVIADFIVGLGAQALSQYLGGRLADNMPKIAEYLIKQGVKANVVRDVTGVDVIKGYADEIVAELGGSVSKANGDGWQVTSGKYTIRLMYGSNARENPYMRISKTNCGSINEYGSFNSKRENTHIEIKGNPTKDAIGIVRKNKRKG